MENSTLLRGFLRRTIEILRQHDVFFSASAITFQLFLCSIPFLLIIFSVLGYILSIQTAYDAVIQYGVEFIPRLETGNFPLEELLSPIIGSRGILGGFGLLVMALFSLSLIYTMKHALFQILEVADRKHPLVETLYTILVFGVLGGIFVFFGFVIWVLSIVDLSQLVIPWSGELIQVSALIEWITRFLPVIFAFLIMFLLLKTISERRISTKASLFGATIFTLLFEVFRWATGLYLGYAISRYQTYYQGYTFIFILAFWGYYISLIFLLSSAVTRVFMERRGEYSSGN